MESVDKNVDVTATSNIETGNNNKKNFYLLLLIVSTFGIGISFFVTKRKRSRR